MDPYRGFFIIETVGGIVITASVGGGGGGGGGFKLFVSTVFKKIFVCPFMI